MTRILVVAALVVALFFTPRPAQAHELRTTSITLDIGSGGVAADIQIPFDQLALALERPISLATDSERQALGAYVHEHVSLSSLSGAEFTGTIGPIEAAVSDGVPVAKVRAAFRPPPGSPTNAFRLRSDIVEHRVVPHRILVSVRKDFANGVLAGEPEVVDVLGFQHETTTIDRAGGSTWKGCVSVFRLGVRHIAEGSDHLLFLLVLLLPAPLVATGGRWRAGGRWQDSVRATAKVVSAFTVGHSLTLALAVYGLVEPSSRLVECVIALSIFFSAIHAARPVIAGKEALVAGAFGLVHGLAFASVLRELGFDGRTLGLSLVAFNLGIEAMQLVVVAAVMPSLIVLARTASYQRWRAGAVALAAAASVMWFFERALGWPNPLGGLIDRAAHFGMPLAVTLAAVAVWTLVDRRSSKRPSVRLVT